MPGKSNNSIKAMANCSRRTMIRALPLLACGLFPTAGFAQVAERNLAQELTNPIASLYTLLIPRPGSTTYPNYVPRLLQAIAGTWEQYGVRFEPAEHAVMVLWRTDRSLIGSMNDAVRLIRWHDDLSEENGRVLDLAYVQGMLNKTPFKAIDQERPADRLARLLAEAG